MLTAASYEQATDRTRTRLAAASFFERTDPSRALNVWERRNSSLLLLLPYPLPILLLHPITNGRSNAGPCLLLHSFEHDGYQFK